MDGCKRNECKSEGKSRLAVHFSFHLSPADFDFAASFPLLQMGGHPRRQSDSNSISEAQPYISKLFLSQLISRPPSPPPHQASTSAIVRKPSQPPVAITRSAQRSMTTKTIDGHEKQQTESFQGARRGSCQSESGSLHSGYIIRFPREISWSFRCSCFKAYWGFHSNISYGLDSLTRNSPAIPYTM